MPAPPPALALAAVILLPALALAVAGTQGAAAPVRVNPVVTAAAPAERRATLFYTAEVHGAVEPCGCTSDPLGDVSRLAALVEEARRAGGKRRGGATGVALVDAGGLLYPEGPISTRERPSADLRAAFLAAEFERLGLLGAALGETDLSGGSERVRPARLAANLTAGARARGGASLLRPPQVHKVGDIAVGLAGVAEPDLAEGLGSKAEDIVMAARRDVMGLRQAGAEVVVVLAAVEKGAARKLARDSGADVVVVGKRVGAGMPRMERVGRAFIVSPAEELQRVGKLELVLRGAVVAGAALELQDAGGPEAARVRREEIDRTLDRLRSALASWTGARAAGGAGAGPASEHDGAFVAAKRREVAELEAERKRLEVSWVAPPTGHYLVNSLVPLRRSLPREPRVVAAMKQLDRRVAAVNLKQATPPPAAEPGRPFYVGTNKCSGCHAGATRFWKGTVHARAWKTLVDGGKQADYKCVGCHVTGFGQVGGASLGFTRSLQDVQCETCHGPGSAHVVGEGNEEPLAIKRDTPETVCLGCHTEEHSDTFQFDPYLRDIVGAGHGPARRKTLGPGVTGHELRSAAITKAKRAGAAAGAQQVKTM